MPECWVCANPDKSHASPSPDSTSVGVCRRCSIFGCNTHADIDTGPFLLYCSPCVGGGGSSPPSGPPPGDGGPGGGPSPSRRNPGGAGLFFPSVRDAMSRFPRFHRSSKDHADAFSARHNISEMIRHLAPRWEQVYGEQINIQEIDEELIAFGIGVTLWSAGLDPGELPEVSEENLTWLARNPILSMYLGETMHA
jgi:hypothetical protein